MAKELFGDLAKNDTAKPEQVGGIGTGTEAAKTEATKTATAPTPAAPAKPEATQTSNTGQSTEAPKPVDKPEGDKTSDQPAATETGSTALGSPVSAPLVPVAPIQGQQAAPVDQPDVTEGNATTAPTTTSPNLIDPDEDEDDEFVPPDELTFLKGKADFMGIKYSNNIGLEALKTKIAEKLSGEPKDTDAEMVASEKKDDNVTGEDPQTATISPFRNGGDTPKGKKISLRKHLQMEKMKLVRLRVTNMDPKKADLSGEIFTVANEFLGTVRKFVAFGEATDNGYHVPYCIYEQLRDKRFLNVRTRKGPHGTPIVESNYAKEFALEVLPPLTTEELARLSASQAAAGGLND